MSLTKPNVAKFLPYPLHRVPYGDHFSHRILYRGMGQIDWLTWKSFGKEAKRDKAFIKLRVDQPDYEFAIQSGERELQLEVTA